MISSAVKTPKILFVNPRFPRSLWGFQGMYDILGVKAGQAPLGLATVAGMTPREFPVELQDENVEPINFDTDADIVAIGCWSPQYLRAKELAQEFRRRGKMVVVGGPYPTLCPERFVDGTFDVVFDGETENTWPEFCQDLLKGSPLKPVYKQIGNIDMQKSPVPRFDLIKKGDYLYYFIQTTRGCPFACEFCDIIVTDGRVPRLKSIPQVLKEIETIAAIGAKYISFSDANLIGNQKFAEQLLEAIAGVEPKEQLSHSVLRRDDHHRGGEAEAAGAPAGGELHQHLRGDRVAAHRQSHGVQEAPERSPAAARQRPADPVPQPDDRRRDDRRLRSRRPSDLRGAVRLPHGSRDPLHDLRGSDRDREDAAARPAPEGRTSPPVRLGDGARARSGRPQLHPEAHDGG